jgi:COP9 signalosome complex subunit 6
MSLANADSLKSIDIHPLVIMNVCDHFARENKDDNQGIFGVLLGSENSTDSSVHLFDSFELIPEYDELITTTISLVDIELLETKLQQYKDIYPTYELLGWYSTGMTSEIQSKIQRIFQEYNAGAYYLTINPEDIKDDSKLLPLQIYESQTRTVGGELRMMFVAVAFKISTLESESIVVNRVMSSNVKKEGESSLKSTFKSLRVSISTLIERITVLQQFLMDTKAGLIPFDHSLLREVSILCSSVPIIDLLKDETSNFTDDYINSYNDTLLATYLACLTKQGSMMSRIQSTSQHAYKGNGQQRRNLNSRRERNDQSKKKSNAPFFSKRFMSSS